MSDNWYAARPHDAPITQGDLILDCPVVQWGTAEAKIAATASSETLESLIDYVCFDLVVMSQSCDLEQGKIENVILCPACTLSEFRESWKEGLNVRNQNPTSKAWKKLCDEVRRGFHWNLSMLNRGSCDDLETEHRIVDFREVYSLPKSFLESLVSARAGMRLSLCPPYREHLSQAFARFFMRVGLPTDIEAAW